MARTCLCVPDSGLLMGFLDRVGGGTILAGPILVNLLCSFWSMF